MPCGTTPAKDGREPPLILHVITGLATGGAEQSLLRLAALQKAEGLSPAVVSLRGDGRLVPRFAELGIPVSCLGLRDGVSPGQALARLLREARRCNPDVLQGWMYHGNLAASLAALACRSDVPVLWNIRQSLYDPGKEKRGTRLAIWLGKRWSSRPRTIVYNARTAQRQHADYGYNDRASLLIPNGFDCHLYRPSQRDRAVARAELGIDADVCLIGMVARYHPMKDFPNFLAAAARLMSRYPQLRFVLVGCDVDQKNGDLVGLIAERGLTDRVYLLGERADVPSLMPGFDVLSTTSAWGEGFPNVLGEAMACGVPCVATDIGDSARIVGDTGVVVPPGQAAALANAWESLITLPADARQQLGRRARERVRMEFSMESVAAAYRDLYAPYLHRETAAA